MYSLKRTEYAHVNPQDWQYKIVISRHRLRRRAIEALEQAVRDMESRCSSTWPGSAWDCNYQIFEEEK